MKGEGEAGVVPAPTGTVMEARPDWPAVEAGIEACTAPAGRDDEDDEDAAPAAPLELEDDDDDDDDEAPIPTDELTP